MDCHTKGTCPFPCPVVWTNSCALSQWCYLTILSSSAHFFCLQSFPESGSFLRLFTSGGQSIGASASASVLPMNIQGWFSFRINWFDLLAVQGTLKSILQYHNSKASVLPMNIQEILISYRINWFDLLAVQGTLKSLLQHHSSKVSVLQGSAFFMVQLSHPYMTTGKCITLTR